MKKVFNVCQKIKQKIMFPAIMQHFVKITEKIGANKMRVYTHFTNGIS